MRTTNAKCKEYVQRNTAFEANNLRGVWKGNWYVIYSYSWWILFALNGSTGNWYENEERYSVSTSKQRGQAHPGFDMVKVSKDTIECLVNGIAQIA